MTLRRFSIFWVYFFSHLLILLVPLGVFVGIFMSQAQALVCDNVRAKYENTLKSGKDSLEKILINAGNVRHNVEYSFWLNEMFFRTIAEGKEPAPVLQSQIIRALSHICAQHEGIANVAFAMYGDDKIYASGAVYNKNGSLASKQGQDVTYWFYPMGEGIAERFFLLYGDGGEPEYLVYQARITNRYKAPASNAPKADFNIIFSYDAVTRACRELTTDGSWFTADFFDMFSMLVGAPGAEAESPEAEYVTMLAHSDVRAGISYTLSIPAAVYNAPMAALQTRSFVLILVTVIVSVALVCVFSYHNTKPIKSIAQRLLGQPAGTSGNELQYISSEIGQMKERYGTTRQALSDSQPMLVQYHLLNLLYAPYDENLEEELRKNGVVFSMPLFAAVAIQLLPVSVKGGFAALKTVPADINDIFPEVAQYYMRRNGIEGGLCTFSPGRFALIANFAGTEALHRFLNELLTDCDANYHVSENMRVRLGVGCAGSGLSDIPRSFGEATLALEYCTRGSATVHYYTEDAAGKPDYSYSAIEETALISALKEGSTEAACNIIQGIIDRGLKINGLSAPYARYLHYQILAVIIKALRQMGLDTRDFVDMRDVGCLQDFEDMHRWLESLADRVCGAAQKINDRQRSSFDEELIDYVSGNLYNSGLSLQMVAGYFDVSMSYISQIFKKRFGVSYSEYVNRSRIEHAMQLLDDKAIIEQVGAQVGYDSAATFRRNFIKYTGSTPSAYQKNAGKP